MRLKTFHAETLAAALELVRDTLGEQAIIVSTQEDDAGRGARVTAAMEEREEAFNFFTEGAPSEVLEELTVVLERQGVPSELVDRLVSAAEDTGEHDAGMALAGALDQTFRFSALPSGPGGPPLMLVGPPGVGKTVSCAKLAARAALAAKPDAPVPAVLIAADPVRVGAVEQLAAYAEMLGVTLHEAKDADGLVRALSQCRRRELILIDTPGANPYALEEIVHLAELGKSGEPDVALVLSAGRDPEEAVEIARAFRPVGATRLVTTGVDMTRRLGSMLAAADAADLALSDISEAPEIGKGLRPINPISLAKLLMPEQRSEKPANAVEKTDVKRSDAKTPTDEESALEPESANGFERGLTP